MKNYREERYLKLLSENKFISSENLALKLDISGRTVRNDLKELNQVLKLNGAEIITKPKCGNILLIKDEEKYNKYLSKMNDTSGYKIPKTSQERIEFLMEYLLQCYSYVKIEDLSELLYISKTSLSQDLKYVREEFKRYNLKLISKPNYGIKVEGSEFDLRLCMANHAIKFKTGTDKNNSKQYMKQIADILTLSFQKDNYSISDTAFQNLIIHIYTAIRRIKESNYVPINYQFEELVNENDLRLARDILEKLEVIFKLTIPEEELYYIALHLAAKQTIYEKNSAKNVVVDDEINTIVTEMLRAVNETYKINFFDDLELRMALSLHLIPFKVRIECSINSHNPIIKDIKTRATLAYNIAVSACKPIEKVYNKVVSDSEIGYFALHFNLALERRKKKINKKNIVIVCGSGRGTAKLLSYRFCEEFDKYLNDVTTTSILNLKNMDFTNIDYVMTTVPINFHIPVPIFEITCFLEDTEIKNIKDFFNKNNNSSLLNLFNQELYITGVELNNKEEVIKYMTNNIKRVHKSIPDNFYELIMERERLSPTEFGNMVALPHPNKIVTEETVISILILNKPIIWNNKKVQLVYLMSITNKEDRDLQYIYKITSKLLTNKRYIKDLIQSKDYDMFCSFIKEIENSI